MAQKSEFVEFVLELLASLGNVRARAMFGGHGIYQKDVMFALIEKDRMYFKVDDVTRPAFVAQGMTPFTYVSRGKTQTLQYYEAPPEVFDDPETMQLWARQAVGVALKAKPGKKKTGKSSRR